MNFVLTDEQKMTRQMVRDFAEKKSSPAPRNAMSRSCFRGRSSTRWASWVSRGYPGLRDAWR